MNKIIEFFRKNKDSYVDSLKSDAFKDVTYKEFLIEDIVKEKDLTFEIYQFIRRNPEFLDYDLISEKASVPKDVVVHIFNNSGTVVKFPIIDPNNKKGEVIRAYVFKLPFYTPKNSFWEVEGIKDIKNFIDNLENKDFRDFFVIFEKDFKGQSYQLSIIAGLLFEQKKIENYAFTGKIDKSGNILKINHIKEKEEVCKNNGLILIKPENFKNINELTEFLNGGNIDIPFLISTRDRETTEKNLEIFLKCIENINLNYLNVYDITTSDLYMLTVNLPTDKQVWKEKIIEFQQKTKKLFTNVDKIPTLHIVNGIATFGLLAGSSIGSKHRVILYHYNQSDNTYYPVIKLIDETARRIKYVKHDILEKSEYIDVEVNINSKTEEIAFIIYLASHNPKAEVLKFLKDDNYVLVKSKLHQGAIPLDADWTLYISEIYSVLNALKDKYGILSFKMFLSMPSAMAMGLGMAIGHFMDVEVYNYDRNLPEFYYPVGNTKDIKPII